WTRGHGQKTVRTADINVGSIKRRNRARTRHDDSAMPGRVPGVRKAPELEAQIEMPGHRQLELIDHAILIAGGAGSHPIRAGGKQRRRKTARAIGSYCLSLVCRLVL